MSASSSLLPPLGTEFKSLLEAKLATYEAARNGSYRLRIFSSSSNFVRLVCIGLGDLSALYKRSDHTPCSCHIRVSWDETKQIFKVSDVDDAHTCKFPSLDSTTARAASEDMNSFINKTRRAMRTGAANEQKKRSREETSPGGQVGVHDNSTRTGARQAAAGRAAASLSLERKQKTSTLPITQKRTAISKRDLSSEVAALAKRQRLFLPPSTHLFPTPRSALIHLYAWAEQHDLCLYHSNSPRRIQLICKPDSRAMRCTWEVVIGPQEGGAWRILSSCTAHDEALHARAAASGRSKPLPASLRALPSPLCPPPSGCITADDGSPEPPPPRKRLRPVVPPLQPYLALSPRSDSPAVPSSPLLLSSFLAASFPTASSNDLSFLSSALVTAGIASTGDVAALVLFDDSSVVHLVEELEARGGWSAEEGRRVEAMLQAMKGAALEVG
ncbi:hypothetical protein JCM6882_006950 [Rhodosporidiobolus microsporus]